MAESDASLMLDGQERSCRITEEEQTEVRDVLNNGGVRALEPYLRKKMDDWKTVPLNVGIIGNSGAGKSSFINAIRGLTADDEGAAKTGVTETTMEPTAYSHPNNDKLKFWDLPGVGTTTFRKENYLQNIGFDRFDFFVIMSSNRFTENDLWLGEQINEKRKKFFFIRAKIHMDLINDANDHPKTHNSEVLLGTIHENIEKNLGDLYSFDNVFLIDNHQRNKYQFCDLEQKLIQDFPKLKREALVMSMSAFSEDMIKQKVAVLQSSIWKTAMLSAGAGLVPVPGFATVVNFGLILEKSQFYFKQLGLDEDSLKRTAQLTSSDLKRLQDVVNKNYTLKSFFSIEGIKEILTKMPELRKPEAIKLAVAFNPLVVLFGIVSAPLSYYATSRILNHILSGMEIVALDVVKTAMEDSVTEVSLDATQR